MGKASKLDIGARKKSKLELSLEVGGFIVWMIRAASGSINRFSIAGYLCAAILFSIGVTNASAQYPDRPIRAIVPFSPGGPNDVIGRVFSPYITKLLGQPVIVENRPGANGHIGIEVTAKSVPNGYTILYSATASTVLHYL